MARPTIGDIAQRAGVSKGAVSFALNGRPGVSAETRARIISLAQEMNWRPHTAAKALRASRTDVVGLALTRPARTLGLEPFFAHILSGIQAELSARSIALQMMIVENTSAELVIYQQWASEHRVDGVVLIDPKVHDRRITRIRQLGLAAVVVGEAGRQHTVPNVWIDDRDAMLSIVRYLTSLGHRRIAHVSGIPTFRHTQQRTRALRDCAVELRLESAYSVPTDLSDTEGAAATRHILSEPVRPTAIIYDNDVMAVAGLGVAADLGVSVPADLSMVAFEDSVLTQLVHPPLTSLTRDSFEFGRQAAEVLLATIDNPREDHSRRLPTPPLTIRESTAPPPA